MKIRNIDKAILKNYPELVMYDYLYLIKSKIVDTLSEKYEIPIKSKYNDYFGAWKKFNGFTIKDTIFLDRSSSYNYDCWTKYEYIPNTRLVENTICLSKNKNAFLKLKLMLS